MKKLLRAALCAGLCLGLLAAGPLASAQTASPVPQVVWLDDAPVNLPLYAAVDPLGNGVNYVRVRDLARLFEGSVYEFNVGYYCNTVHLVSGMPYINEGSEMTPPVTGDRPCLLFSCLVDVNGRAVPLSAMSITDDVGGGHLYFKLRDLGEALGFGVSWDPNLGVMLTTRWE